MIYLGSQFIEVSVLTWLASRRGTWQRRSSPRQVRTEAGSLPSVCPFIFHKPIGLCHPHPRVGLLITHTQNIAKPIRRLFQLSHPWSTFTHFRPYVCLWQGERHPDTGHNIFLIILSYDYLDQVLCNPTCSLMMTWWEIISRFNSVESWIDRK